jgi:hypothetical protein
MNVGTIGPPVQVTAALRRRSSRVVWAWCVVYTVLAPPLWRSRRREELRGHLWEAEQAGHRAARVVRSALAGVASDLTWALGRGLPPLARSFGTTTPYLVLAAACPIQAAFVSFWEPESALTLIGPVGGFVMLGVAGLVAFIRKRRSHR